MIEYIKFSYMNLLKFLCLNNFITNILQILNWKKYLDEKSYMWGNNQPRFSRVYAYEFYECKLFYAKISNLINTFSYFILSSVSKTDCCTDHAIRNIKMFII